MVVKPTTNNITVVTKKKWVGHSGELNNVNVLFLFGFCPICQSFVCEFTHNIKITVNYNKRSLISFFARFIAKIVTFDFFSFIFICHLLQNFETVLMQFCRPSFDFDNKIKSSAYKREVSLVRFGRNIGSDLGV